MAQRSRVFAPISPLSHISAILRFCSPWLYAAPLKVNLTPSPNPKWPRAAQDSLTARDSTAVFACLPQISARSVPLGTQRTAKDIPVAQYLCFPVSLLPGIFVYRYLCRRARRRYDFAPSSGFRFSIDIALLPSSIEAKGPPWQVFAGSRGSRGPASA